MEERCAVEPRQHARRLRQVVGTVLVCLLANAVQADPVDEQPSVVLLAPADSQQDFATLLTAISAQLSDFEVELRMGESEPLPEAAEDQAVLARDFAAEQGALVVVWLTPDTAQVCLFVDDGGEGLVQQRQIPEESDDWEELCDAIASMLRSMLVPWLDEIVPESEPPTTEAAVETRADTEPDSAVRDADPVPAPQREVLVLLGARVGYEPVVMSQEDRYLNGAYVGLGLCLGRYLGFDAGLAVFQIARVSIDGQDLRLTRWPVRLAASGRLPIRRAVDQPYPFSSSSDLTFL